MTDLSESSYRVERAWAYLALEADGDEGIAAATAVMPDGSTHTLALVFASEEIARQMRPHAEIVARESGRPVTLACFEWRIDMETITP